jgi:aryl-alcohol dehydrogenase-like predicted oxidoreductase
MGCLSFGSKWQPWLIPREEALPILKYAYDHGINTFDMADTYSNGETERIFGAFLKEYSIPRHKIVILSKCFFHVPSELAPVAAETQGINDGNQARLLPSVWPLAKFSAGQRSGTFSQTHL